MSEELVNILGMCFGLLVFLGGIIGVCAVSGYYSNQQKLECYKALSDKPTSELFIVCGKISS